ncbi:hypothetical protein [Dyella choica]|uniref:Filamentous hemagglutinin n=1 Tax=Dyella choica TaxID=1927959 RepID=A0A432M226_9GAMM|nr:hypothetical protein [Dyella choica]RUL71901.1 hypothetical protein EKH80_18605 [Dyella choica]
MQKLLGHYTVGKAAMVIRAGIKEGKVAGQSASVAGDALKSAEQEVGTPDHLLPDNIAGDGLAGRTAQDAVGDLKAGKLPGTSIGGPGTPREMPATADPDAAAKEFATELFGGAKPSGDALIQDGMTIAGKRCADCWVGKASDGSYVTYRPAGFASSATEATTATVEIKNATIQTVNGGKSQLKLKFPKTGKTIIGSNP